MSDGSRMTRVGYLLGRYPDTRSTFVFREMSAIEAVGGASIKAQALARPRTSDQNLPDCDASWTRAVASPPGVMSGLQALMWFVFRRPLRACGSAFAVGVWQWRAGAGLRGAAMAPLRGLVAARRATAMRLEHVHAHFAWPSEVAWLVHRLTDLPFSFTVHTDGALLSPGFRQAASDATFIVSPSHQGRATILSHLGQGRPPVEVVRAGVTLTDYAFRSPESRPRGKGWRALCVAGLDDFKGHDVLLRALAESPALRNVTLDCVGDGPERQRLERRIVDFGLSGRVTLHGSQTSADVARMLTDADVFVLASRMGTGGHSDNIPVALMEAMAAGVPVVATRLKGIPELVRDGETGWLAQPDDHSGLAAVLAQALAEDSERTRRALLAHDLVASDFDVRASAAKLTELFRASATRSARPRVAVVCDWFLREAAPQAAGLVAAGAEVVLVCVRDLTQFNHDANEFEHLLDAARRAGVAVIVLPSGRADPRTLPAVIDAWRELRRRKVRVAHVHWNYDPRLYMLTLGTPVVYALHDPSPHPGQKIPDRDHALMFRQWERSARAVVVHGAELQSSAERRVGPTRVEVGALGVEMAQRPYRRPSEPAVLFFGRLEPYKGLEVLSEAMEEVWRQKPDVRLIVAGDGPLRHLVPDHPSVDARLGYVPEDAIDDLYAEASVVALPYTEASQSAVGLRAIARGIPIVVSQTGALPDLVHERRWAVPPGNAKALARALLAALDLGDDERLRIHKWADARFSWQSVGAGSLDLYVRLGLLPAAKVPCAQRISQEAR